MPPALRLDQAGTDVPVALFYGSLDALTEPSDIDWLHDQLALSVIHIEKLEAGHATFLLGKDMSWFGETVLDLINKHHYIDSDDCFQGFFC